MEKLFNMIKKNNTLDIKLIDTCMFFNGHFIGVLTNNDSIIQSLKDNEKFQGLLLLDNKTTNFNIIEKVSGRELEDTTLSKLEKNIGRKLRRNFS